MDKDVRDMLLSAAGIFLMLICDGLLICFCGLNLVLGVSCYVFEEARPSFLICSAVSIGVAGICYWKMKKDLQLAEKFEKKWSGEND